MTAGTPKGKSDFPSARTPYSGLRMDFSPADEKTSLEGGRTACMTVRNPRDKCDFLVQHAHNEETCKLIRQHEEQTR